MYCSRCECEMEKNEYFQDATEEELIGYNYVCPLCNREEFESLDEAYCEDFDYDFEYNE